MRRFVLAIALVACGHPKASGPKWPEPSTTADDGGESIEPQPSAAYAAAAIEKADDDKPATATASAAAPASDDKDKPATATPTPATQPTVEDVLMGEEIIIEIDGD